jgi:hypothetical protein
MRQEDLRPTRKFESFLASGLALIWAIALAKLLFLVQRCRKALLYSSFMVIIILLAY